MESAARVVARVRDHIEFLGPRRIASAAAALAGAAALAWFLFAPSPAPLESALPLAGDAPTSVPLLVGPPATVRVHVAGAVRRPGVYEVPATARIVDAVRAAGGPTPRADLDGINLAQTVRDSEQVYVPSAARSVPHTSPRTLPRLRPTTTVPAPAAATGTVVAPPPGPTATPATGGTVNLNTASAAELESLPGVGPATARRIISHRQSKGPFVTVADLLKVTGIGPARYAVLKPLVGV